MSDQSVQAALRSDAQLVVVEAPAGCGKTFQGVEYAKYLLPRLDSGRLLILTHTNAACDVFSERTSRYAGRVEIRTIDSLVTEIARTYHLSLGLPADVVGWAYEPTSGGFSELGVRVAMLLRRYPHLARLIAQRYPYVVCDEHQDCSEAQNEIVLSIFRAGAITRVFGDPMQSIYSRKQEIAAADRRWQDLKRLAEVDGVLDTPHRWKEHSPELGDWISEARSALQSGRALDLRRRLPPAIWLIRADNSSLRYDQYMLSRDERRPIDRFVSTEKVLVLTATNSTARSLRAFFNRSIPLWEGHTRDALWDLVRSCKHSCGDAGGIGDALIQFVQSVGRGFSQTAYAKAFADEILSQCSTQRRKKPAKIQHLARIICESPDYLGAASALATLRAYIDQDDSFDDIKLDQPREYTEAVRLGQFEDLEAGMAALSETRSRAKLRLPERVISTVHKAKGFERDSVLIIPCDQQHLPDSEAKRRLLYVALSRATKSLALVVPRTNTTPLINA